MPTQAQNRELFANAIQAVGKLNPDNRIGAFNRSTSKLPGQQSLTSIIRNQLKYAAGAFEIKYRPPDLPRDGLHFPDSITFAVSSSGATVDVSWSTENGSNGSGTDIMIVFMLSTFSNDPTGLARYANLSEPGRATGHTQLAAGLGHLWTDLGGAWGFAYLAGEHGVQYPPFSLIRFSGNI
jgi:hypothetical protein